jgi:membrane associated rhomboid family serine protease
VSESIDLPGADPRVAGPLDPATARSVFEAGRQLAAAGEFERARAQFSRVVGSSDPELHVAALLGLADAHYRLDDEGAAVAAWEMATQAPETPLAWEAWRQLAAAHVRVHELPQAIEAYRQADRRAPPDAKAEIASRLGWLNKEMGNSRAAGRYFGQARRGYARPIASYAILALTVGIGVAQLLAPSGQDLFAQAFALDKGLVAQGQWWRLVTVVLVHAGAIHLAFNMYFLYLIGPIIETLYGSARFLLFYLLTAAAASTMSFIFLPNPSVGASGALFGLAGALAVTMRVYKPLLGRQATYLAGQIVFLIIINLVFDFGVVGGGLLNIDIFAHLGGLAAGAWLGLVIPPLAPTLRNAFVRPGTAPAGTSRASLYQAGGVAAVVLAVVIGVAIGTPLRRNEGPAPLGRTGPAPAIATAAAPGRDALGGSTGIAAGGPSGTVTGR